MKRILLVLFAVTVLLSGCSQNSAEETSKPSESTLPVVSEISSSEPEIIQCEIVNVKNESYANVRKGPGTDQEAIGKAKLGDKFEYIEEGSTSDWIKIKYGDEEGYVYKDFIVINA